MREIGTKQEIRIHAIAVATYILLVAIVFVDLFLRNDGTVVSHYLADGSFYFSRMRAFGYGEIAQGNLPLWNPHIYSGTPFIGAFQSGLFYAPNLMYAVLPLDRAMNLDAALHVMLAAYFTFLWVRGRGVSPLAAFFAGSVFAFGG